MAFRASPHPCSRSFSDMSPAESHRAVFEPTPESIPPADADLVLRIPDGLPTNIHPLVIVSSASTSRRPLTRERTEPSALPSSSRTTLSRPLGPRTSRRRVPRVLFLCRLVRALRLVVLCAGPHVHTRHRAQRVQNFAYGLIHAGIHPGDRVAVIAPNSCVLPLSAATPPS